MCNKCKKIDSCSANSLHCSKHRCNHKCCNKLIDTLYYKTKTLIDTMYLDNSERINYITTDQDNVYRGSSVRLMTDAKYNPKQNTKIFFNGERSVPKNGISGLSAPQYYEKLLIQTADGEIDASTIYNDSGTGFETTIDSVDYYVNHATNKYKQATIVRIIFDNNGLNSGTKFSRVVDIL